MLSEVCQWHHWNVFLSTMAKSLTSFRLLKNETVNSYSQHYKIIAIIKIKDILTI